nr:IPT/TIG domain-containing protein [Rufibacter sediminis]
MITVNGRNFEKDNFQSITINGQAATDYTLVSATQLTVRVPAGAAVGQGNLVITTLGGSAQTNFTVIIPAPSITSISPSSGPIGTEVTINGSNLDGVRSITFNGVTASEFMSVNSNQLIVIVPDEAATGDLVVTTAGGSAKSFFTVIGIIVTSFSPERGPIGTLVTVNGTNFPEVAGIGFYNAAGQVLFAEEMDRPSETSISGRVPEGAVTGRIVVVNEEGETIAESGTDFTVTPPAPTITSLSSSSKPVGEPLLIYGTNLVGVRSITFNGIAATQYGTLGEDGTQLLVTIPAGATSGPLVVTTDGGEAQFNFIIETAVTSFSPERGPIGTLVTVNGTNFPEVAGIGFYNAAGQVLFAEEMDRPSETSISGRVPEGAVTGRIVVVNEEGETIAESGTDFTVTPPAPTITSLSSSSKPVGEPLLIYGTNLVGVRSITFNGIAATQYGTLGEDGTQLQVTVPVGATSGPLVVTTDGGEAQTMFYVGPSITSLSPNSGLVGAVITVKGQNLNNITSIDFNGTAAPDYISEDINTITVTVPVGATSGPMTVTTAGGTAQANFLVLEPTTLPVELVEFAGKNTANGVALTWTTASERNNAYFEVQASANPADKEFKTIQRVNSKVVNSASATSYATEDRTSTNNAVTYYRLKQVDLDGSVEYSKTIVVENTATVATASVRAYPNPFDDANVLNLEVDAEKAGKMTVVLYYVTGKKAFEKVFAVESGISTIELPLDNAALGAGLYILSTELNGQVSTLRVIKK